MRCCIKCPLFDSFRLQAGYTREIKFAYVESFFHLSDSFSGMCRMQVLVLSFQRRR